MESASQDPDFEAPSIEELQPLFPSYEIELFIAQGGMGAVYKARQTSLDRPVALKILPSQFGDDPQFRESFQAEARAMARLNHPNLIAVYDFGDIDGMLFIIMEYVEGKSLHYSAHGKAIEQKEAARLAAGICRGLAHAHHHGILHRDIKPANILLTSSAEPKIGDFGLARPVGHHDGEETIFGTPGYSAPEVLNHPERVDQRADIYSTGVILYELLTGTLPGDTWKPPSSIANVDPSLDAIVRRAVHPSPDMRYADANQIADDLGKAAAKLEGPLVRKTATAAPAAGAAARPIPGTRPVRPMLSSKKSSGFPAWAIFALLLGVGGLTALFVMASGGGKNEPPKTTGPSGQPKPKPEPRVAVQPPPRERPKPKPRPDKVRERPMPKDEPKIARNDPPKEKPMPKPEPEPEPMPEPEPEPAKPVFDTVAFLDKGRTALMQKSQSVFAEREEELEKNIDRFQRKIHRLVRRLDNQHRDAAEEIEDQIVASIRAAGNRLDNPKPPEKLPKFMMEGIGADLREAYRETVEDQERIDQEFDAQIQPLRDAYLTGIARQIETLRKGDDTVAIEVLEEESSKTLDSMPRFIRILKGEDPDPPEPAPEEKEGDGKKDEKKD